MPCFLSMKKQDCIVQQAVFRNCPKQNNSHDCGLFAVAVIWHLLEGKEIHSSVFTQDHIGALREALYRGLLPNAEWATLESVAFAITVDGEDFQGWLWFLQHLKLPPRYGFRNSNISESANNMFHDARNGNWLDAIDGILIKMSLRITKSQSEYEGKDGVVDNILGLATKRWENCVGCRLYASGNDGETYSVYQKLGGELEEEALLKVRPVDCVCDCGKWQAIGVPCVHGMAYLDTK
ncbi:Ulp1 protease family protein [Nitzschia inconspicua]|uniref:Ulp1 protease family protein n=1 Tax=Nitzschia inconspicua TaxID=303405 RepID=A0A9K3PQJ0_9STRA|nr:Ulp1 protease family protein [Nitzschia inconspicua]